MSDLTQEESNVYGRWKVSDFMQGYSEGFDEGRAVGKTEIAIILQDLIAELRARPGRDVHSGSEHVDVLFAAADRAEARLREVGGGYADM